MKLNGEQTNNNNNNSNKKTGITKAANELKYCAETKW